MTRDRGYALTTGLLYLSTHITSVAAALVLAAVHTGDGSADPGDAVELLRTGSLLEVLLALGCVGTGVALLPVLRRHAPALAHGFLSLRVLEAAVIAAGTLPLLALASSAGGAGSGAGSESALEAALLGMHDAAFLVGQGLVISVNTLVIGWAIWRTGIVFRWIGALGLLGGSLVLTGNLLQLFGVLDRADPVAAVFALPVFAFEIWFAGYLVFRGFRLDARAGAMPGDGVEEPARQGPAQAHLSRRL